jgi:hypothetical protein
MENRLDGNAAAGVLEQIFPFEMTTVEATCAGCGQVNVIGALVVYKHGMGTIVRCPSCEWVLIRVAEIKGCYWLDMRGLRVLQIPVES